MLDLSWLSQEAKQLHAIFEQVFYSLALVLFLLGVVIEYFKIPLGGMPGFSTLAGRCLVAAILLVTYPEVSNLVADVTDALANHIGSLNSIKLVLSRYYDKLFQLQMSWTSIKDSVLMLISFVTFFLLYISVYIADAAITYAWVLLYVFSPLLIVLFVLPATSGATKALYRTLFEIGAWKIVWAVLATLLWSSALSQINEPQNNINFITAVSFNLILAGSLLLTPIVVNALAGAGLASLAAQTAGIAAGAAVLNPGQLAAGLTKKKFGGAHSKSRNGNRERSFSRFQERPGVNIKGFAPRSSSRAPARTQKTSQSSGFSIPPHENSSTTVSFKAAAAGYTPPTNRSSYPRQPVQRAMFAENRKQDSSKPIKGV